MKNFIFFLFATALLLVSCASTKKYTLDELPEEQLIFTFGGGFTGEFTSYLLLPNGQLFSRRYVARPTKFRELESLNKKVAKELFDTFDKQNFSTLGYDDPGNMTYTIEKLGGENASELTWGGPETEPVTELKTYWRRVMSLVSEQKELTRQDTNAAKQ